MSETEIKKAPTVCPLMAGYAEKFTKCGCDYPQLWTSLPEALQNRCGDDGCVLQRITLASGRTLAGAFEDSLYWSRRGVVYPADEAEDAMRKYRESLSPQSIQQERIHLDA